MTEVLTLQEACAFLKMSKPSLYQYARRGAIPAHKLGKKWKFHRESLDQWLRDKIKEETLSRSSVKAPTKNK